MLSIQNLTYRIGGRTLLDKVSVNIPAGHRVGLVGPNGTGKSTLFRLIAGEIAADDGEISMIKGSSLGVVRQDFPEDDTALIDIVLSSDIERTELMKEAETTEDMDRIGYIYERLTAIDAYDAPARAASILSGLGFNEEAQALPITAFSGGWRARVALACVLFVQPNVLLLDEPTNHLDFESMVWLEGFLARYRETLIIISHDREILNKTVTQIVHLENKKLTQYTGNYDAFERRRAERLMNQQALHEKQMAQKAHLMKFVDRFRAKASKARQAQSRLKAIEKMDIVDAVIASRVAAFTFPQPKEMKSPLIRLDGVDAGYVAGKPVLRNMTLAINNDDRIGLLGANGNGKSTLIKVISDRLATMAGEVHRSARLKIGYFAQFQTDELDVTITAYETMQAAMSETHESKVRAMLGQFGFDKHKADTLVGALSGGEKARLLFCLMSFDAPHIMLLDEPTNHLDIEAREALIQALNSYTGAVIIVSHDPHLIECVADQLWLVEGGRVRAFDDDLEGYRKYIIKQRRLEQQKNKLDNQKEKSRAQSADAQNQTADVENEIQKLESHLEGLRHNQQTLEGEIALCFEQSGEPKRTEKLNAAYAKTIAEIDETNGKITALIAEL
ncbi:MAG: ATP-binding cassette domain-containing protein [Alphaproteobacteria bacterium]|nr:ATP-binding cassette domain-containing protein [Alphaproteobacteria bacterium]